MVLYTYYSNKYLYVSFGSHIMKIQNGRLYLNSRDYGQLFFPSCELKYETNENQERYRIHVSCSDAASTAYTFIWNINSPSLIKDDGIYMETLPLLRSQ